MLDEDLRKQMGEAFEEGNFAKALELSREFDKQVLRSTEYKLKSIKIVRFFTDIDNSNYDKRKCVSG